MYTRSLSILIATVICASCLTSSFQTSAFAAETRGLSIIAKDPVTGQATGEVKLYNKAWAVFIGIDRYQEADIPTLRNAVNDARSVKKVLEERYKFDDYRELYDSKATQKNILELFQDELADRVGEDDAVFVFWAGHGTQQENNRFGEIGELIPYDGSSKKHSKNISMQVLKESISKSLKARHVLYVMDSCYGGLMADTRDIPKQTQRDLKALQVLAKEDVREIFTAGSKGEQVLDGINGHSVFTYRLIEALEAAGDFITANEIQGIITRNVISDALKADHKQTPQFRKLYNSQGDFVFVPSSDYKLAEQQAKIDKDRLDIEQKRLSNEKLNKQIQADEAAIAAALKAGDEKKLQNAELDLRKKQALKKIEDAKQQEREEQLRRDEQSAADLNVREAERHRILEEARRQQAKLQENEVNKSKEFAKLDAEQQKQKAEEEKKNAELRRLGDEKRKKALEVFVANTSIEAAIEDIRKADTAIADINREFDADLARQKEAANRRLAEKIERYKQEYDKRLLELKNQPAVVISVTKPSIPPRDEFETKGEYESRVAKAEEDYNKRLDDARAIGANAQRTEKELYDKGNAKAEAEHRDEISTIEQRLKTAREEAVKPFRERITTIAAKEYPISPQSLKLTIGMYDPDNGIFPVSITSSSPAVKLSIDGKLALPRDAAKLFKQQYQNGLVRVEAYMKTSSSVPIRVAMLNDGVKSDADNYLMEYVDGEFISGAIRKRREKEKEEESERQRKRIVDNFVRVPGGCFQMGDTFGDGSNDERPVHDVCVKDFAISKYDVTQRQWLQVMGNNPSNFTSCGDDCPVEQVSWNDVQEFISKLNSQLGSNFRLPTEAEWEYAARTGGKHEKYSGSDNVNEIAWYSSNSGSQPHPVGQKQPNGLGIYDMSGNVWQWVSDRYGTYPSFRQQDPQGPSSGSKHVFRGGCWYNNIEDVRATNRFYHSPDHRFNNLGFRLVSPVQ